MLEQSTRGDIEISINSAPQTIVVKVDPGELEIALFNLALNARDAMPDGGRIEIIVGIAPDGEGSATGTGMAFIDFIDTAVASRNPFASVSSNRSSATKTVDKGTGLGLSQVYGFVKQSNGTVTVSSEPGVRTTFRVLLPICPDAPAPKPTEISDPQGFDTPQSCWSRIILMFRWWLRTISKFGCKLSAVSAEIAIEALHKRRDIELVMSDIVMPGMSGLELGRLIRERHPNIPVIPVSGYSDKAAAAINEGFTLIRKPYSPEALGRVLNSILTETQGGRTA